MTRTRTGDYKDPVNAPRERRQSRNGYSDPRAIPKKAGAGYANWGVLGCELNQQEQTSAMSNTSASPTNESKIAVIDAETFSRLQNSSQNETTATNEESLYETESQ